MIKKLCLILTIIFTVSAILIPSHAADIGNTEATMEAVSFFNATGIAGKYAVPSLSGSITRAEFAELTVNLMGLSAVTPNYLKSFSDVADDNSYKKFIHTAVEAKLFSGTGETTFGPDEMVTFGQAVKVAVNMLGARHKAEMTGGYLVGYYKLANELGILKNISADYNAEASINDILTLMYNTIRADIIYVSKVSTDNVEYKREKGKNILSEYHSIYKAEGTVTSDYYEYISKSTTADSKRIVLNDNLMLIDENMRFGNLVGKKVELWYREEAEKNLLLYVGRDDNNVVIVKNNENSSYNYKTNTYTVYSDSKSMDFKVDLYATILVNGEINEETSYDIMFPKNGKAELIDNNNDNRFDVVKIEKFYNGIIESFDTYNNKLVLKKNQHISSSESAFYVGNDTVIYKDGKLSDKDAILSGNAVMVYKGKSGRIKLEISTRKIMGTVSNKDDDEIWVDGDSYMVSPFGYITAKEINAGGSYKFFFNSDGDIIYAEVEQQLRTGYVIASGQHNPLRLAKIKILDSNSVLSTYNMTENIIVETISGTAKIPSSDLVKYLGGGSELVLYKLNNKNEVCAVTIACPITTKDEFENQPAYPLLKLDYLLTDWPLAQSGSATKAEFNSYANDINNWVILSTGALMFNVPVPGENLQDSNLSVTPVSQITDGRNFSVNNALKPTDGCIEFYSYGNGTAYADLMIHYMSEGSVSEDIPSDLTSGGYGLVEDIVYALGDDGNAGYHISVIEYGKGRRTLTLNDEILIKRENFGAQTIDTASSVYADATVNPHKTQIQKGDIIRYMTNSNDAIRSLALMYDAENEVLCYKENMSIRGKPFSQFVGKVDRRIDNVVEISDGDTYKERLNLNGEVWIFDTKRNTCKIGSSEDITEGDIAVTYHYYYRYRQTIVYKKQEG